MEIQNHSCGKLKSKARELWLPAIAVVSALVISPLTFAGINDGTEQDGMAAHEGHVQGMTHLSSGDGLSLAMPSTIAGFDPEDTPLIRNGG